MNAHLSDLLPRGRPWRGLHILSSPRKEGRPGTTSSLNDGGPRCGDPAYTFLDNGSRIALIVLFFGARGPRPHLLGTTHMQDGHASCHTHTWRRRERCTDSNHGTVPEVHQNRNRKYNLPPKPFHDLTTESNVHKSKTRQHYHPVQQSHSRVFT